MTSTQMKEIRSYISRLIISNAGSNSSTPLNPHRMAELESKLFVKAVKAANRHNPLISPLIPFLKSILKIEAKREAARIFNEQLKNGECSQGDLSLDVEISPNEEETFKNTIGEPDEVVRRRKIKRDVREVLTRLSRRERIALEPLMYRDVTKEMTADRLGISRPTLDRFLKEEAIPHFIAIWNGAGKKLRG